MGAATRLDAPRGKLTHIHTWGYQYKNWEGDSNSEYAGMNTELLAWSSPVGSRRPSYQPQSWRLFIWHCLLGATDWPDPLWWKNDLRDNEADSWRKGINFDPIIIIEPTDIAWNSMSISPQLLYNMYNIASRNSKGLPRRLKTASARVLGYGSKGN